MNPNISDLFFAHDKEDAAKYEAGDFIGYDQNKLRLVAKEFRDCIIALGVDCPTEEELVKDFQKRT